jgi:hypothetical protein
MGIEGDDFKKNLPGLWVGKTASGAYSKKIRIKILKIDGNDVNLTGFVEGSGSWAASEEVYGRLENSTLLITWPAVGDFGVNEKYIMKRDDSNNLILDGRWKYGNETGKSKLKKIE